MQQMVGLASIGLPTRRLSVEGTQRTEARTRLYTHVSRLYNLADMRYLTFVQFATMEVFNIHMPILLVAALFLIAKGKEFRKIFFS